MTTARDVPEGDNDFAALERSLRRGTRAVGIDPESISPLFTCADRVHVEMIERSAALGYFQPELGGLAGRLRTSFGVP